MPATVLQAAPVAAVKLMTPTTGPIIWTPRFVVIFFLTLVIGLSLEGLLAEATLLPLANASVSLVNTSWVILAHVVCILGCWVAILIKARSSWLRLAVVFGCIWAVFTVLAVLWRYAHVASTPALSYVDVVASCALLGSYICLSTGATPLLRWDNWFFCVALVGGACAIGVAFLRTPADSRTMGSLANDIATAALFISVCVWWLRPVCWQRQAGPALLFGLAPAIALLITVPGVASKETPFFLAQVSLLCLMLAAMRILQGEMVGDRSQAVAS